MPIFDDALIICEKFLPDLLPLFEKAKLFMFDANGVYDKAKDNDFKLPIDTFFLPFPVSVVILKPNHGYWHMTLFEDCEEGNTGLHAPRNFLLVHEIDDPRQPDTAYVLVKGTVMGKTEGTESDNMVGTEFVAAATKKKLYYRITGNEIQEHRAMGERELSDYLAQIIESMHNDMLLFALLNIPENFILEKSPAKQQRTGKKIPRSHQRPEYTLLSPARIREEMRLPPAQAGTRASPRPHDVRKHEKWLSAKRYRFDRRGMPIEPKVIPRGRRKGELYYKHQIIEAHWSGPSENRVGNKIYRVILDR